MWKRAAKRPSDNIQVQGFLASCVEMWIGTEEICTALRISAWQMRNWRKKYGCPIVTLPSGNVALSKVLYRQWLLALGKMQLEATNRYRTDKIEDEPEDALTENEAMISNE